MKQNHLGVSRLSLESASAITLLHNRLKKARNTFEEHLIERALDIVAKKPTRNIKPAYIARNALSDARKFLNGRYEIVRFVNLVNQDGVNQAISVEPADIKSTSQIKVTEILDWIVNEPSLNSRDRSLLIYLVQGEDATEIAARMDLCVKAVRKNISRARARARIAWKEVG
ncbi:hypothetical protein [Nostoc sp.]|uniref:hypothetical protein n=1 Tax=Nostoc sp. TaxID=1180 RepID=UPI002FF99378